MKTTTNSFINRCVTASLMTASLIAIQQLPAFSEAVEINGSRVHTTASWLTEETIEYENLDIGGPYPGVDPNQSIQTLDDLAEEITQDSANSINSSTCTHPEQLNFICVEF